MAGRSGTVWFGDRRVGRLREDADRELLFAYDPDWLAGDGFPVSVSLPLNRGDAWVDGGDFFGGLLPEGATRTRIARRLGLDENDETGLLLAIGADCAGALCILSDDAADEPAPSASTGPEPLDESALVSILRSAGEYAAQLTGEARRFSLAGAQDKLPVIVEGERLYLPDRHHPSTHILKFETVPRVCLAEYMGACMAAECGLTVAMPEFRQLDGQPWLLVPRYDRVVGESQSVRRLHQEDLMQALAEPAILKYQRQGGPGLDRIARLLREQVSQPARAIPALRDWQIVNVLIGNWDGHAKNLALLYREGSAVPELAPFYDLVSIEFLNQSGRGEYSRDLALAVGQAFTPEKIGLEDWQAFARDLGIPARPLLKRVAELADAMPARARRAREQFADAWGDHGVLDTLERVIAARSRWVLNTVRSK